MYWNHIQVHRELPVVIAIVVSDSLQLHELQPARFLCPWNYPGKNTGVGCHFLFQGIFPTQRSSPALAGRLFTTEPPGNPRSSLGHSQIVFPSDDVSFLKDPGLLSFCVVFPSLNYPAPLTAAQEARSQEQQHGVLPKSESGLRTTLLQSISQEKER